MPEFSTVKEVYSTTLLPLDWRGKRDAGWLDVVVARALPYVRVREMARRGGVVWGILLFSVQSGAALPGLRLEWDAPAQCPSKDWISERVSALLAPSDARPANLSAHARVRSQGSRFSLAFEISGPSLNATRSLQAAGCDELAEATALLIALTIDPEIPVPPELAPATAPSAPQKEPPALAPPEKHDPSPLSADAGPRTTLQKPVKPEAEPTRVSPWWFAAGLDGGVHDDGLPGVTAAFGGRVSLGRAGFAATLGMTEHFSQQVALQSSDSGASAQATNTGRVHLETRRFSVGAGYLWALPLRVGIFAGADVLQSVGTAEDVEAPTTASVWWVQANVAGQVQVPVWSPLFATAESGAGVSVVPRPRFELGNWGAVAEARRWGWFGRAGLGARFEL